LRVVAVNVSAGHRFSKETVRAIELVEGRGVRGDAHFGTTIKHRSRVAKDASQANLRQVHLLHEGLFTELRGRGFHISPGEMGENITTRGVNLLDLSAGTRLLLGGSAVVEITGLRNPCSQIEAFKPGLLAAVLQRRADGALVRKVGVMGIVVSGGEVKAGDSIVVAHQPGVQIALQPV
jgi:hypothetical protein